METQNNGKRTVAVRLRKETLEYIKAIKEAYEAANGKKYTMDEFVTILADNVKRTEPDIYEIYEIKQQLNRTLREKIAASIMRRRIAETQTEAEESENHPYDETQTEQTCEE